MIIKPYLEFLCTAKLHAPKSYKAQVNFSMKKKTKRLEWIRVTGAGRISTRRLGTVLHWEMLQAFCSENV